MFLFVRYPKAEYYVYTGDVEVTPIEILDKVRNRLNVKLDKDVKFIYLHRRKWVEADKYPYFTLLGQALGSIYLGFEALSLFNPGELYKFSNLKLLVIKSIIDYIEYLRIE